MKILLINQAFVSPNEPGHTRHYELGKYLYGHGDTMSIVASNRNYQTGKRVADRSGLFFEETFDGVRVLRSFVLPGLHRSFLWRIITFLSFSFTSVLTAMFAGPVDVVIGTSPPIFQAASALFIAFLRRKPFVLEVRDLWPEFAIDMGVLKNPILIRLSRWLEAFLYRRAKLILVNSPAYKDYLVLHGVLAAKIHFIPYGTDLDAFVPGINGDHLREEYNLQGKFVVLYAGALGMANDIYTLLRAAERLKDEQRISFVIFGDGRERTRLQEIVSEMDLQNVVFAGTRPKADMPAVLASSDVCLAILQDITMFSTTYPNKVFDYMASGKPTVLVIDGVIRKVIEASGGGVFVQPGDDAGLAAAVLALYKDPEMVTIMGRMAREYVEIHFDRHDQMAKTRAVLCTLLGQRQTAAH